MATATLAAGTCASILSSAPLNEACNAGGNAPSMERLKSFCHTVCGAERIGGPS
ncbi:hypothetical protein [Variovorax paradoxus]|uniref:hypothetical protein n=1 Tax=Variovorax paradoxus TaxID=34073 RepID=UPI0030CD1E1C